MQFKMMLAFFVFGCVFVIVGQVVTKVVVPQAHAQGGAEDGPFDTITVRTLSVVDVDGKTLMQLEVREHIPMLNLFNEDGTLAASMAATAIGGSVVVNQPDGTASAQMLTSASGGRVIVNQPDGTASAQMPGMATKAAPAGSTSGASE